MPWWKVPAAERMWPLVTLGMARCRSSKNAAPLDPATTGERAIKCRRAYVMKGYTEWSALGDEDKDPRTCVPNAKGPDGSKSEQRDEMAAWRAKTSVAPCIVMAMKADGTLADSGAEVPAGCEYNAATTDAPPPTTGKSVTLQRAASFGTKAARRPLSAAAKKKHVPLIHSCTPLSAR